MTDLYTYDDWQEEQIKDPEFIKAQKAHKLSYQITRLRNLRGLSQAELAKRIGTHQASISRLESGRKKPNLEFLEKVIGALNGVIEFEILPEEEVNGIDINDDDVSSSEFPIVIYDWPKGENVEFTADTNKYTKNLFVGEK